MNFGASLWTAIALFVGACTGEAPPPELVELAVESSRTSAELSDWYNSCEEADPARTISEASARCMAAFGAEDPVTFRAYHLALQGYNEDVIRCLMSVSCPERPTRCRFAPPEIVMTPPDLILEAGVECAEL